MVKERILYMDALKLFAITLVVIGHVVLFMAEHNEQDISIKLSNPLYLYIYAFHMPLFMTISGFFSSKILYGCGDLISKFKQLIIPCISLAIIFYLLNITSQNMWYLWSLFICYATTFFFCKIYGPIDQWGGNSPDYMFSFVSGIGQFSIYFPI